MLGRGTTERWFNEKLNAAFRWLELVIEIGWVIALFADWMKLTWFTEASKSDWAKIRDSLIHRRHWIREMAKEILRTDFEWMMTAPICTSFIKVEVTFR
jgi:hypothetical protein